MRTYDPLKALQPFLQAEAEHAQQQLAAIHALAPGVYVAFVAVRGHDPYAVLCIADAAATFHRPPLENDYHGALLFRRQIGHMTLRFKGDANVWRALAFARQQLLLAEGAKWNQIPEPVAPYALDLGGAAAVRALLRARGSAHLASRASTALALAELAPSVFCARMGHDASTSYELYAGIGTFRLKETVDEGGAWTSVEHARYALASFDLPGSFETGREFEVIAGLAKERLTLVGNGWHPRPRYRSTFIVDELAP